MSVLKHRVLKHGCWKTSQPVSMEQWSYQMQVSYVYYLIKSRGQKQEPLPQHHLQQTPFQLGSYDFPGLPFFIFRASSDCGQLTSVRRTAQHVRSCEHRAGYPKWRFSVSADVRVGRVAAQAGAAAVGAGCGGGLRPPLRHLPGARPGGPCPPQGTLRPHLPAPMPVERGKSCSLAR